MSVDRYPSKDASERNPVEQLFEEFVRLQRRGENLDLSEFARMHPEFERDIRDLFPVFQMMEEAAGVDDTELRSLPTSTEQIEGHTLGDYRIGRVIGSGRDGNRLRSGARATGAGESLLRFFPG